MAICLGITSVAIAESKLPDPDGQAMGKAVVELIENKSAASTSEPSVTIDEPGFEGDGKWRFARNGTGVKGYFSNYQNYIRKGIIDALPDRGMFFAYNNGPESDLYQVLGATLAVKTTYRLSVEVIDSTFANPFPGGELRLGFVSAKPTKTDDYGLNLLKPIKVVNPTPFNDKEKDPENKTDGLATWTYTFTTGAKPTGLGKKLRIEIRGGGKAQSIFDNVRLDAHTATPAEIKSAARVAARSPQVAPVVVMLGDSTTDRGMPKQVKKLLDKRITSGLQRTTVINAGKGGDNATSALKRLKKDVLAHRPDIVTVSFGLNDTGGRKPDQFKDSLKKIVKTLRDADIQVILMTSTPFDNDRHGWGKGFRDLGGLDEYMDKEFCEKMRSLADGKKVLLCDLHAIFKAEFKKNTKLIDKVICPDGVHLTAEGNILAARHIAPIIYKLLTGKQTK
jgi:lysophospholipase L1-like esterase